MQHFSLWYVQSFCDTLPDSYNLRCGVPQMLIRIHLKQFAAGTQDCFRHCSSEALFRNIEGQV